MDKKKGVRTLTAKKEVLYLQLGVGTALRYGVSGKAALLDIAARAGLAVPTGIILIDEAWRRALGEGLIEIEAGRVVMPNETRLFYALKLPNFEWELVGPFAVRAAFSAGDADDEDADNANADSAESAALLRGPFPAQLDVNGRDPEGFIEALRRVWESGAHLPADYRRDVIIQRMVDAQYGGVAVTRAAADQDSVFYTQGSGEKLAAGQIDGEALSLRKLGRWQAPRRGELSVWATRVQALLRDVRRAFNHRRSGRDWEIEWADDGQKCWLIEVRPAAPLP